MEIQRLISTIQDRSEVILALHNGGAIKGTLLRQSENEKFFVTLRVGDPDVTVKSTIHLVPNDTIQYVSYTQVN